ncbi:MAG: hypothetical protein PHQ52_01810 [Candidatus Omnitrophica bacterium]|nr:hypothetical protein [Candidatus Omnitrophota bacterium]
MKKYIKPKTKAITLDNDQAILHVCIVGGFYINTFGGNYCLASAGIGLACNHTPKGALSFIGLGAGTSKDAASS